MSIEASTAAEAKREFEEIVDQLRNGIRDPEVMRRSRARMDQMREELRKRIGIVEVAVDLVRDARNQ